MINDWGGDVGDYTQQQQEQEQPDMAGQRSRVLQLHHGRGRATLAADKAPYSAGWMLRQREMRRADSRGPAPFLGLLKT